MVESRYIGGTDALITSRRVQWASRVDRDVRGAGGAGPGRRQRDGAAGSLETLTKPGGSWAWRWGPPPWRCSRPCSWPCSSGCYGGRGGLINLPLAAATAICAAAALWFGSQAISAHGTLRAAKQGRL